MDNWTSFHPPELTGRSRNASGPARLQHGKLYTACLNEDFLLSPDVDRFCQHETVAFARHAVSNKMSGSGSGHEKGYPVSRPFR